MVEIKFCGMMRAEDARAAAELGARYVGVILADGPRRMSEDGARQVLAGVASGVARVGVARVGVARVGVFGAASAADVAATAGRLGLDGVQLHADPDTEAVADLRRLWSGFVWVVLRVTGTDLPAASGRLFEIADAVVLDARVAGRLGGTGTALDWNALRPRITPLRARGRARLVLAGGLNADNVAPAIAALEPDVVDVSSGIESAVGVKDPDRMRAFRNAVHAGAGR